MSDISTKAKALAILPKFTGFLSLAGSLFIIYDVVKCGNKNTVANSNTLKRNSIFHRIMLGLSIFDCIGAFVNIMSTWPTPSDQSDSIYLASGNTETCTAQGFFNEFGNITTPLYSAALCVWYLLILKYKWKEEDCKKYELYFHAIPITVGLSMAVAGLPLTLYNNSGYLCWYAPYPAGCTNTDPHTCTRGEMAGTFRWIHYGIIWSCITFVTFAMASIYLSVRKLEDVVITKNSIMSNTSRTKSRAVAVQALLYVCALYLTWTFTTALRISQTAFKHNSYVLLILMATFFPLQGFWNALIYFRPRYQQNRTSSTRSKFSSSKKSEQRKTYSSSKYSRDKSGQVEDLEGGRVSSCARSSLGETEEVEEQQETQADLSEE